MKYLILLIGLTAGILGTSTSYGADVSAKIYGGEHPLPWGMEAPFPWNNIEGLWQSEDFMPMTVRFQILRTTPSGTRYLSVRLVDGFGFVYASGVGVARKNDRIVRARVSDSDHGDYYVLVRTYKKVEYDGTSQQYTFMTIRPLNDNPEKDIHYFIQKVGGSKIRK